jgi:hypothetical protein
VRSFQGTWLACAEPDRLFDRWHGILDMYSSPNPFLTPLFLEVSWPGTYSLPSLPVRYPRTCP